MNSSLLINPKLPSIRNRLSETFILHNVQTPLSFDLSPDKPHAFQKPVLFFQKNIWNILICIMICINPYIQKAFPDKTEHTLVVFTVRRNIKNFFQSGKDIKQPGTVLIQKRFFHNHHIEAMAGPLLHAPVICLEILRIPVPDYLPCKIQVFLMMRMNILVVVCLNPVMPWLWKENI